MTVDPGFSIRKSPYEELVEIEADEMYKEGLREWAEQQGYKGHVLHLAAQQANERLRSILPIDHSSTIQQQPPQTQPTESLPSQEIRSAPQTAYQRAQADLKSRLRQSTRSRS